ncbi:hypothetical protein CDAR_288641 [Caerostris darwini]|uniref:Uncharacterized protein n=1 Tax=Caerostris darwini TaxID=1538125 RepID=A0AAV4RPK8_9ARAC|nr:hypothetical protein CDAR_288641 [Caerostris darwini]
MFRIHQVPIGKLEARRSASSTSSGPSQTSTSATAVLGPSSVSPLPPSVSTFPLVREGDTLLIDFPITGDVSCPEHRCDRKFVCKSWSSVVWGTNVSKASNSIRLTIVPSGGASHVGFLSLPNSACATISMGIKCPSFEMLPLSFLSRLLLGRRQGGREGMAAPTLALMSP